MNTKNIVKVRPFVEFVNSRDPEEEIDHSSWHSCAVGDFVTAEEVHLDSRRGGQR